MKQLISSAVVAAIVSLIILQLDDVFEDDDTPEPVESQTRAGAAVTAIDSLSLSYTDDLVEDTWVNAARTPGADRRTLSNASNSVCYVTKIEIKGVQDRKIRTHV
jgi:hypothetical protein